MRKELEDYVQKATADIKNPEEARLTRLELEDHLLTKLEILCLSGLSQEDAARQILSEMGEVLVVAQELGRVHRCRYNLNCHVIYYESDAKKSFFNPEHALAQFAREMAQYLSCPCDNCLDDPKISQTDMLLIFGCPRHKKMEGALYRFVKGLKSSQVKDVMLISSPVYNSVTRYALFSNMTIKYVLTSNWGSYVSQTALIKLLGQLGINIYEELYCPRALYLQNRISNAEKDRIYRILDKKFYSYKNMQVSS